MIVDAGPEAVILPAETDSYHEVSEASSLAGLSLLKTVLQYEQTCSFLLEQFGKVRLRAPENTVAGGAAVSVECGLHAAE